MSDKLREKLNKELLDVLNMNGTPDIIAIFCAMRSRCASAERPWPFKSSHDAVLCFQKILDANRKKYDGISVITDAERSLIALRKDR